MNNIYDPNFAAHALANRCDQVNPEFAETVRKSIVNADCWRKLKHNEQLDRDLQKLTEWLLSNEESADLRGLAWQDKVRRIFNHAMHYSTIFVKDPSL